MNIVFDSVSVYTSITYTLKIMEKDNATILLFKFILLIKKSPVIKVIFFFIK